MDVIDKKYYKIKEVEEMTGLPASTLRFWESQVTIIKPRRNDRGSRFYTPDDVEKIRMVKYLLHDRGLKIEAAQEQLKQNHTGVLRHAVAVRRLKEIRAELQRMLDALNAIR